MPYSTPQSPGALRYHPERCEGLRSACQGSENLVDPWARPAGATSPRRPPAGSLFLVRCAILAAGALPGLVASAGRHGLCLQRLQLVVRLELVQVKLRSLSLL